MRINRQTLLKIAEDTVDQRVKTSRSILAVYLYGSMNGEAEPLLGESGDVDLVFIHDYDPERTREFVRLTDEITLDILHQTRTDYRVPRELRTHPWLGPAIYGFKIMYDPRHFLDFAQASLRDQYFRPRNVLARAQVLAGAARQAWVGLLGAGVGSPESAGAYLDACANAANALVSLEGDPMPERRLLTQFFDRMQGMGQPALFTGLLELLGAGEMDADDLRRWLSAWDETYVTALVAPAPPEWGLHPQRKRYYQAAIQAQLSSERPADALWPLLTTWTRTAGLLPEGHRARTSWEEAAHQIGLIGEGLPSRLEALDAYLDLVEETLDAWGSARGVE